MGYGVLGVLLISLLVSSNRIAVSFYHQISDTATGKTPSNTTTKDEEPKTFPRVCAKQPPSRPVWEWHRFSNSTTPGSFPSSKKLLIATYSAFGEYARLLEWTSPINKEYAKRWGHDIVILQGTTMILSWDRDCHPPEERSRFNKIDLLKVALEHQQYDQLLLLDADTLMFDFNYDVTTLVRNTTMLVAQRTHKDDDLTTSHINNGITLWNLRHPLTSRVAKDWDQACRKGIPDNRPFRGDQYYLRQVLDSEDRVAAISSVWDEFFYRDGTVIKHFQRSNDRSWSDTGLDTRQERIQQTTNEICTLFGLDPSSLDKSIYTTPPKLEPCITRRASKWNLTTYSSSNTPPGKRVLLAQYAAFENASETLHTTSPINHAFAKRWHYDLLEVQGTILHVDTDREECDPEYERAVHNKIPILMYSLGQRTKYDYLLLLSESGMMVDFKSDILSLVEPNDMVVAHRPTSTSTTIQPWNISTAITLWNLRHKHTAKLVKHWLERTETGLVKSFSHGTSEKDDQHYLQKALRHKEEWVAAVRGVDRDFDGEHGSMARHYPLSEGKDIQSRIQQDIASICQRYPSDCSPSEQPTVEVPVA
eukprot:Nitzschia sp. Nitz4//scaffold144_size56818//7844//9616//NITZ4_006528-RA/size56818-processed-gene-0.26-mRNA-1//-1//CDS//3329536489//7712//frame0